MKTATSIGNEAQARFVRELLVRLVRLSYFDRIEKLLPDPLLPLLPEKPRRYYKYADQKNEVYEEAKTLYAMLKAKQSVEEVKKFLDFQKTMVGLSRKAKLDMLINCLLFVGSKSFSHLMNNIER